MNKLKQVEPYISKMDSLFKDRFKELEKKEFIHLANLKNGELPKEGGIYVFYHLIIPIYVGRTKNIRQRIQLHMRDSSGSESATFAFNLTKNYFEAKGEKNLFTTKKTRKELMGDSKFKEAFITQKNIVKKMNFKFLIEEQEVLQTMLEPYLSIKLGTYPLYNKFETH